ncbi:hypothetical protein FKM82_023617, partial [Ascaphus truei]
MSTSGGNGEQWQGLESLGISRKELALAEALQMEYDALSRLRTENRPPGSNEAPLISWDVVSQAPSVSSPPKTKPPPSGDYLYIYGDGYHSNGRGGGGSPKNLSPPPLPPRTHIWSQGKEVPPPNLSKGPQPRDVNLYSGEGGGKLLSRRISEMEEEEGVEGVRGGGFLDLDYEGINDTITRLNLASTYDAELLRQAGGHWKGGGVRKGGTGKPVARSKTLPPQVPPRTYGQKLGVPAKSCRVSVGP